MLLIPRSALLDADQALQQIVATGTVPPLDNQLYDNTSTGVRWLSHSLSYADSDVVSCAWDKDVDSPSGNLSITLKNRDVDYASKVSPGDVLVVYMDDQGTSVSAVHRPEDGTLVTMAIVDRVNEQRHVDGGATVVEVVVVARDLSVLFTDSSTVFDPSFAVIEQGDFTGTYYNKLLGAKQKAVSPLEQVLITLRLLFDPSVTAGSAGVEKQWKLRVGGSDSSSQQLIKVLDPVTWLQNPIQFYTFAESPSIIQAGNVWSLLTSYCNPLLNEFFIDIRDESPQERTFRETQSDFARSEMLSGPAADSDVGLDVATQSAAVQAVIDSKVFRTADVQFTNGNFAQLPNGSSRPALVMRERPYDQETFNLLPVTHVWSTEIESYDVARSSHDVLNWFRVRFPGVDVKLQEILIGIAYVDQSVAKFGYRCMDVQTRYMFLSQKLATQAAAGGVSYSFGGAFDAIVKKLVSWFAYNEQLYAGGISMRYKPSIRVGTRLRVHEDDDNLMDFYVQGVRHLYSAQPGASRTQLVVTRGRDPVNPLRPVKVSYYTVAGIVSQLLNIGVVGSDAGVTGSNVG